MELDTQTKQQVLILDWSEESVENLPSALCFLFTYTQLTNAALMCWTCWTVMDELS